MDILHNKERKHFGLDEINAQWKAVEVKTSSYDNFLCTAYVDDRTIKKCILVGDNLYSEMQMNETLSDEGMYLLPKTDKGKPTLFSASNLLKRTALGMALSYSDGSILLYIANTECDYYDNYYDGVKVNSLNEFKAWISNWCSSSLQDDIDDVQAFAKEKRKHIKYREGDVFRFRIGRREYGYGRILLDYNLMRKNKLPFWDVFMGTPLICSVYRIITEDRNVTIEQLSGVASLPSVIMADNKIYYGDYEIIGNIPVTDNEDYPIMYGYSIDARDIVNGKKKVFFQCGKVMKALENTELVPDCIGFINNGVGFSLNVKKNVLLECIAANSNMPYWTQENYCPVKEDLRNPAHKEKLDAIKNQFLLK